MSDTEKIRDYPRWFRYAEEDLSAAMADVDDPAKEPRHACFQAQQAAEKAIKTIFVFLDVEFPYRHDLELLIALLPDSWELTHHIPRLARLTGWVVEARYPGDWPEPTTDDARQAVEHASMIVDDIRAMLIQHGAELE